MAVAALSLAASSPRRALAETVLTGRGMPTINIQVPISSGTPTVQLTIYASDDDLLVSSTWKLWYKGVDVSGWIGGSGVITNPGNLWTSVSAAGSFTLDSGSHWLKSEICGTQVGACSRDSVQVTYTPPPPPPSKAKPVVTLAQRNDARLLDGCATCASVATGYSTPAFYFNGAARTAGLRYSTELARATGYVELDVKVSATNIPSRLRIMLRRPSDMTFVTLSNDTIQAFVNGDTASIRLAAQYDASADVTRVYKYDALVTAFYGPASAPTDDSTQTLSNVRVFVQNESGSPYGRGWVVSGDSRIHQQTDGNLLLAGNDGTLTYFTVGSCGGSPWSCSYTAPAGDYSTLVRNVKSGSDTVWTRTSRDGVITEWSSTGLMRHHLDRWGNLFAIERMGSGDVTRVYRMKYETVVNGTTVTKYITFAYNGSTGKLSSITLPDGRQSTMAVGSGTNGELTTIVDPDGVTALSAAYSGGRLVRLAGRNAAADTIIYDSLGQMSKRIAPAVVVDGGGSARDTTKVISLRSRLLTGLAKSVSDGTADAVRVESAFLLDSTAQGTETKTWADISGAPAIVRSRTSTGRIDSTRTTYSAFQRPVATSGIGNGGQEFEWSGSKLVAITDVVTGLRTAISYISSYDQVEMVMVGADTMIRNFYSGSALAPDSSRSDSANVTRFTYDSRGRALTVRPSTGITLTTAYETTHANASSVVRTGGAAGTVTMTYDAAGRPLTITDPAGRTFTTKRDALNRDTVVSGPLAASTRRSYNDITGTYTVTDPMNQVYTSVVNARGWLVRQTDPNGVVDSLWYDRFGRLTRARDRRGAVVMMEYDGMNRLTTRAASMSGGAIDSTTFTYDPGKLWVAVKNAESIDTLFVDAGGRPTRATTVRSGKHFEFAYGFALGNLVDAITVKRDSASSQLWTYTTGIGFDDSRRAFQVVGFDGKLTTTLYDRSGREVRDSLPTSLTASAKVRKQITHTAVGPQTESYLNVSLNGLSQDRYYGSYDALDRIGQILRYTSAYPIERTHAYDSLGRVERYTDRQQQVTSWEMVYAEDPYGDCPGCWILVDSIPTIDWVTLDSAAYAYDKVANRIGPLDTLGTGNRLTAFAGWKITYDAGGFMTSRRKGADTLNYSWNALGQLVQVTSTVPAYTVTYGYDGFGRRVRKTVNGVATRYLVEGDRVLVELDNSWAPVAKYSYYPGVDRPHAMQRNGTTYYYTQDAQANVTGLLNATGGIVHQYNYTPYGEAQGGYGNIVDPYQYKGREWDAEARLYYMRARYYDPQLGRFISEDPIGIAGGLNVYAFAGGEPVNRSDPSGLDCRLIRREIRYRWQGISSFSHYEWELTGCDLNGLDGALGVSIPTPFGGPSQTPIGGNETAPSGPQPNPAQANINRACWLALLDLGLTAGADILFYSGVGAGASLALRANSVLSRGAIAASKGSAQIGKALKYAASFDRNMSTGLGGIRSEVWQYYTGAVLPDIGSTDSWLDALDLIPGPATFKALWDAGSTCTGHSDAL
jgi:RHS repeat-associated protein